MSGELYKRYRPAVWEDVCGQPAAVGTLRKWVDAKSVPHTILLCGPSGTGKTTIARILKTQLGCGDRDYREINAANARGIDDIREVATQMTLAPITGRCRVFVIDEAHQLTKDAQSAALKILEDTPRTAYFILCTTDPAKLLPTIRTRCATVETKPATEAGIAGALAKVCDAAGIPKPSPTVLDAISDAANGSYRQAVVIWDTIRRHATDKEQIAGINQSSEPEEIINVAKQLTSGAGWATIAKTLKASKAAGHDPEAVRRVVIGYASAILLNGADNARVAGVLSAFARPTYDGGWPLVTLFAFNAAHGKG